MQKKVIIIGVSVVAIVAAIVALLMLSGDDSANKQNDAPAQTSQATTDSSSDKQPSQDAEAVETTSVTIKDYAFAPANIRVKVGDKVTWTNEDSVGHDVVVTPSSADGPKSELLAKGESYSFTFTKAGTYNYLCTPHPYMKGTVTVVE